MLMKFCSIDDFRFVLYLLNFRVDQVSDACVMAIEDDSKHACCIRITDANGIDLLPMKSSKEWQNELNVFKI